jgi:hypothetical protein
VAQQAVEAAGGGGGHHVLCGPWVAYGFLGGLVPEADPVRAPPASCLPLPAKQARCAALRSFAACWHCLRIVLQSSFGKKVSEIVKK